MNTNNNLPMISIFTACKNGGRFLKETLDSIFSQTFSNFEVVLVDGASIDNTLDVLNSYSFEKRLRWISEPDKDANEGFHKALAMTTGKYTMCLPISDGLLDKKWLQKCMDVLENDINVSLVWGFPQYVSEDGTLGKVAYSELFDNLPPQKENFFSYWLATGLMYCELNYCVRSDVYNVCMPQYKSEDFFDQQNPFLKFNFNFNTKGYLSHFIPAVASFGRIHSGSGNNRLEDILSKTALMYVELIKKYKIDLLNGTILHCFRDGSSNIIKTIEKRDLNKLRKQINSYRFFTAKNLFFGGCKEKYNFQMLSTKIENMGRTIFRKWLVVYKKI